MKDIICLQHPGSSARATQRGRLNANKDGINTGTLAFEQCWTLDETGNWSQFRSDDDGSGTWDIEQARTANTVNEILSISPPGKQPNYDAAGNLVRIPSDNLSTGLNWETFTTPEWDAFTTPEWSDFESDRFEIGQTFTYDAWNRLVSISDGGDLIQTNHYDGRNFRIIRETTADAPTGAETRHCYFSAGWQSLEERLGTSTDPERQYVWGQRYIDDCLLRDRDTGADGTLDERLYPTQDANWNVTALVDTSGTVQERDAYSPYGVPSFLDASFGSRTASSYDWETLFDGYRYDPAIEMFAVRNRVYKPELGIWLTRDPLGYSDGMNVYAAYFVPNHVDSMGFDRRVGCFFHMWIEVDTYDEQECKSGTVFLNYGPDDLNFFAPNPRSSEFDVIPPEYFSYPPRFCWKIDSTPEADLQLLELWPVLERGRQEGGGPNWNPFVNCYGISLALCRYGMDKYPLVYEDPAKDCAADCDRRFYAGQISAGAYLACSAICNRHRPGSLPCAEYCNDIYGVGEFAQRLLCIDRCRGEPAW